MDKLQIPTNLSTYNVVITDSMGCTTTSSNENITQPDIITISNITVTNVSCNGG